MSLPNEWRPLGSGISAWFEAPSQTVGAALVARIAAAGFDLPEVNLRVGGVQLRIGSEAHELAGAISSAAGELGLTADPSVLQAVGLRVSAIDSTAVIAFWHAVLGYSMGDDGLFDPLRRDPAFSFQSRTESLPLRNRLHVDVSRLQTLTAGAAAATAAGGRETFAGEYYRTIADPEGNEVDIVPGEELSQGAGTADWRVMFGGMTFYPATSPAQTVELATAVAGLVDETGMPRRSSSSRWMRPTRNGAGSATGSGWKSPYPRMLCRPASRPLSPPEDGSWSSNQPTVGPSPTRRTTTSTWSPPYLDLINAYIERGFEPTNQ